MVRVSARKEHHSCEADPLQGASLWSVWLGWRVAGLSVAGVKQGLATVCVALAAGASVAGWALLFWAWT